MTLARSNQDWSILLNEYNICKKKLESKREGLKILVKDLEQAHTQKDVYKNKVAQLHTELAELKKVLGGYWQNKEHGGNENDKKMKTLRNLLQMAQDENQHLQNDFNNLKQLYSESQRDNQLLRVSLSRNEANKKIGINEQQRKEKLVSQLEESNSKIEILEQELQIRKDERKELEDERDSFRDKNTRLNVELNYILHNDAKRIVDIDTLVLENQYLKEVIKQYKEEKAVALGTAARYKEALKQRQSSGGRLSYLDLTSPKKGSQHEGLFSKSSTMSELQRVNKALTESLSEKDLALKHQRNTNRILGTRVSELEKKLKTLEISGLWSHEQRTPRDENLSHATSVNVTEEQFNADNILIPVKDIDTKKRSKPIEEAAYVEDTSQVNGHVPNEDSLRDGVSEQRSNNMDIFQDLDDIHKPSLTINEPDNYITETVDNYNNEQLHGEHVDDENTDIYNLIKEANELIGKHSLVNKTSVPFVNTTESLGNTAESVIITTAQGINITDPVVNTTEQGIITTELMVNTTVSTDSISKAINNNIEQDNRNFEIEVHHDSEERKLE